MQIPGELVTRARLFVAQTHLHVLGSGRTHGSQGGANAPEWDTTPPVGELADLIAGRIPARERDEEIVRYRLIGLPGTDAAILKWAYNWAVANGVGSEVDNRLAGVSAASSVPRDAPYTRDFWSGCVAPPH